MPGKNTRFDAHAETRIYTPVNGNGADLPTDHDVVQSIEGRRRAKSAGRKRRRSTRRGRHRKYSHRKRNPFIILLLVFLILCFSVTAFVYYYVLSPLQRVNSQDVEDLVCDSIAPEVSTNHDMDGYTNIALFGVDSRKQNLTGGNNRSDTIIIASINDETGELKLISLYRDTLVDIRDREGDTYISKYSKANAAYSEGDGEGGPAAAVRMLNRNLDLNITDYVTVGFEGLASAIDALGGIDLKITDEERELANQYMKDMKIELGTEYDKINKAGKIHMSGIQATAYCRIRYTAGDDYRRSERQREVLQKTFEKAKNANPLLLVRTATEVTDKIATSLSNMEILSLILHIGKISLGTQTGFPREEYRSVMNIGENRYYDLGSCVVPTDLSDNVEWLHGELFDEKPYYLSETCTSISSSIHAYKEKNRY